jgi:N-acetylglucosamine-6-phosphate deacetylase
LVPGIHLEGPFISSENGYRGVHPLNNIRKPAIGLLRQLMQWSGNKIRMITIAAELDGSEKLCKFASSKGIIVSLGHQQASEKQIERLGKAGARTLTHLGNGLPHLVDRHVNPIWSGLGNETLSAMIIADGFHLPLSVMKTIFKVKGVKNTILVSDLSPLGGLKPGNYSIWGKDVTLSPNGFLFDPSSGYLAASSFTLMDCANFLLSKDLVKLKDIHYMGFLNPLRLLGIRPALFKDSGFLKIRNKKIIPKH